jgi:peptidoglycan hydrolase-like protein with peptidoglycan-binding domain
MGKADTGLIQQRLEEGGLSRRLLDGDFGEGTESAAKAFQGSRTISTRSVAWVCGRFSAFCRVNF